MSKSYTHARAAILGLGVILAGAPAFAQSSVKVAGKEVQVHGSIQQGFVISDQNNFLTMETSKGSGEMTDGAFNLATQLTSKLRIGGQVYARNIGELGNGQVQLDWAFADYKFNQAFGVRAGKVKTPLGLYNDTQDMEFLHTWALLPQGLYPLDLRSVTIAHVGGDAYGRIGLAKAGSVQYNVYGGYVQDDTNGGYRYGIEDAGFRFGRDIESRAVGFDTRWSTPIAGLTTGYSLMHAETDTQLLVSPARIPVEVNIPEWRRHAIFGEYQGERVRLSGEWRHEARTTEFTPALIASSGLTSEGWFGAGSVRLTDRVEVGSYHSRLVSDVNLPASADNNHVFDTAVTTRVDLTSFWHVKVEGHFVDGYGNPTFARGFYRRSNPQGLDPTTKMLVVRTGVSF